MREYGARLASLLGIVYHLSLGLLIGSTTFFGLVVAPEVFATLPRDTAAQLLSGMFPALYRLALPCSLIALGLAAQRARPRASPIAWAGVVLLAVSAASVVFAGWVLEPQMHALQARIPSFSGPPITPERLLFGRLHGLSMLSGAVTLTCAVAALACGIIAERVAGAAPPPFESPHAYPNRGFRARS